MIVCGHIAVCGHIYSSMRTHIVLPNFLRFSSSILFCLLSGFASSSVWRSLFIVAALLPDGLPTLSVIQMHSSTGKGGTSGPKSHTSYIIRRREGGREGQFASLDLRRGKDPRSKKRGWNLTKKTSAAGRSINVRRRHDKNMDIRIGRRRKRHHGRSSRQLLAGG